MSVPKPPADLKRHGRELWKRFHGEYELDSRETEIMARVARLADLEAALVAELDGGAGDRERGRLLATTNLICRLLSSLDLPGAEDVKTPRQQRAGTAAAARWAAHNEVAKKRRELGRG